MKNQPKIKIRVERIDHLGIVATAIKQLGIQAFFDKKIPKQSQHHVTNGQVVTAMILIGLGYVHRALHITPRTLKGLCLERLIGKGIKAEHFNDDVMGRCLDRIYETGPTELFLELLISILPQVSRGEDMRFHVDTTSMSVYSQHANETPPDGCDEKEEQEPGVIQLARGLSKDNHPELKQFLISLVTNQHGIPCYFESISGNRSDKKNLIETIKQTVKGIQSNLKAQQKALYIADSAVYTKANIEVMGSKTRFISRAPATLQFVKQLTGADLDFTPCRQEGYRFYRTRTDYGGVDQTAVVVESQAMKKRQHKQFEKKRDKRKQTAEKALRKLCRQKFYCRQDACSELERFQQQYPLFTIVLEEIEEKRERTDGKRGKPVQGTPMRRRFQLKASLTYNEQAVAHKLEQMGRFVLVTNETTLDEETILTYYKEQSQVEKGFRFLKDPVFAVDNVFLKSPKRIMALSMIMVLSLLVYNFLDRELISQVRKHNAVIRGVENRLLKRPTMRAVFILFQGISKPYLIQGAHEQAGEMDGMEEEKLWHILEILGEDFVKMYQ